MDLPDFVRRVRNDKRLSLKDVEDRSAGRISRGYVNQIENRQIEVGSISIEKLEALSAGLGIKPIVIFRIALGMAPDSPEQLREILAETFDGQDLSAANWTEIEAVIEFHVNQKKGMKLAVESRDRPPLKSHFKRRKV